MASRACLLMALCSLFTAAWSGDQAHQEGVLMARRQAFSRAQIAARRETPPASKPHARCVEGSIDGGARRF
jgi:hypothetical protein